MHNFLRYGPAGLFLGLTLEYFGLPVPGETLLLLAGAVGKSTVSLLGMLVASVGGSALGSWVAYRIARTVRRETLMRILSRFGITSAAWGQVEARLVQMRLPLLLFSRYVPGVRHVVPYALGLDQMPEGPFVVYNALSALLWCGPFLLAGRFVGAEWRAIALRLHRAGIALLLILAALGLGWWLIRSLLRRKEPPG